MLRSVLVSRPRDSQVFSHYGVALFLELLGENVLQRRESNAHQAESGSHCEHVLFHLVPAVLAQFPHRQWTRPYPWRRLSGLDGVAVIDGGRSGAEQPEMPIHGVLIQRNQKIDPVSKTGHVFDSGTDGEKRVTATNDGLIGIVGEKMEAPAGEYLSEDIAWGCHTLSRRASNGNSEGILHPNAPCPPPVGQGPAGRKAGLLHLPTLSST